MRRWRKNDSMLCGVARLKEIRPNKRNTVLTGSGCGYGDGSGDGYGSGYGSGDGYG